MAKTGDRTNRSAAAKARFEASPTRKLDMDDYLILTCGRDAWRKALCAVLAEVAGLVGVVDMVVERITLLMGLRPRMYVGRYGADSIPTLFLLVIMVVCLATLVLFLPDTVAFACHTLRVPVTRSRVYGVYHRRINKAAGGSTRESGRESPTATFYHCVRKSFEDVTFRNATMSVADAAGTYRNQVRYASVYKAFLSRGRGVLVLRCKWKGGARDVVVDLAGLAERERDDLLAFLDERIPARAHRFGDASWRLGNVHGAHRRYDPWDGWVCGSFVRRTNWKIAPDAPLCGPDPERGANAADADGSGSAGD